MTSRDLIEATPVSRGDGRVAKRPHFTTHWGRSIQVTPGVVNSIVEMVRVELPSPQDLTIVVGTPSDGIVPNLATQARSPVSWSWNNAAVFMEIGGGGTSNLLQWVTSTLGDVRHVTARTVIVRVQLPDLVGSPITVQGRRVSVTAGIGRPSQHQMSTRAVALDFTQRLAPWVKAVQLLPYGAPAPDMSAITVQEMQIFPDGAEQLINTCVRPFSAFATPQPINRLTNGLSVTGGSASTPYLLTQYWEL